MAHDREVAGIRCLRVLERLSDFVDGELTPEMRTQIEAHLRGCDWCERFGAEFSSTVESLRRTLGAAEPVDESLTERLLRRLDEPG